MPKTPPDPPPDYAETFRARGNEVDCHDRASCAAFGNWMMEVAGVHAAQLGISVERLNAAGWGWALSRLVMECGEMPKAGEKARLRTWPSRLERLQFRRDFFLYDMTGQIIARAVTFWVIMDLSTRKLLRMPPEYRTLLRGEPELAMDVEKSALSRLPLPEAALASEARILARRADLDMNRHVSSVRYMDWIMEAVPQSVWEGCRLRRLEMLYRAEMARGEAIARCMAVQLPDAPAGEHVFAADMRTRENDAEREVLRALMYWQPLVDNSVAH